MTVLRRAEASAIGLDYNGSFIFPLQYGQSVDLERFGEVSVFKGAISIVGFTITPSSTWFKFASPNIFETALTVKAPVDQKELKNVLNDNQVQSDDPAILEILKIKRFRDFPVIVGLKLCGGSPGGGDLLSLISDNRRSHLILFQWPQIARLVLDNNEPLSVVAVSGAKGSGKSTFTRYLCNSFLNVHEKIYYLDTDIGQPEFTPPGVVSAHTVSRPIFAPPPYNQFCSEEIISYFCGAITPSKDPHVYLRGVRECFKAIVSDLGSNPTRPIIVLNLCGWTNGLGIHLMEAIVSICKVNLVVGIGWKPTSSGQQNPFGSDYGKIRSLQSNSVRQIPSATSTHACDKWRQPIDINPPAKLRFLRFLGHFDLEHSNLLEPAEIRSNRIKVTLEDFFSDKPLIKMKIKNLQFLTLATQKAVGDATRLLTGTLIGLCSDPTFDCPLMESDAESEVEIKYTTTTVPLQFRSYAFVHSISKGTINLWTNPKMSIDSLKSVNSIVISSVDWTPDLSAVPRGWFNITNLDDYVTIGKTPYRDLVDFSDRLRVFQPM
eukprot:GHVL01042057.1.p1 GENE.GHVL01042057.1~~GHVL01042057.1.p1  ORF type:complete len:548 (+),score=94.15 GHVL01042057.1:71-1714(+)